MTYIEKKAHGAGNNGGHKGKGVSIGYSGEGGHLGDDGAQPKEEHRGAQSPWDGYGGAQGGEAGMLGEVKGDSKGKGKDKGKGDKTVLQLLQNRTHCPILLVESKRRLE